MPIYAYRCDDCGHQQDFLQKFSDAPIAACPSCGSASFHKQLTAPAFQLKGTGWYVTDFRQPAASPAKSAEGTAASAAEAKTGADSGDKTTSSPASTDRGVPATAPSSSDSAPSSSTPSAPASSGSA